MMTPNQLERGTQAFRKGYWDCYHSNGEADNPYQHGTFAWRDWQDGFAARAAECRNAG